MGCDFFPTLGGILGGPGRGHFLVLSDPYYKYFLLYALLFYIYYNIYFNVYYCLLNVYFMVRLFSHARGVFLGVPRGSKRGSSLWVLILYDYEFLF